MSGLILMLMLFIIIVVIARLTVYADREVVTSIRVIPTVTLISLGMAYILARTAFQSLAAALLVATCVLSIFAFASPLYGTNTNTALYYLVLPLLISLLFLPGRITALLTVLVLTAVGALPLVLEGFQFDSIAIAGPLGFISLLMLMATLMYTYLQLQMAGTTGDGEANARYRQILEFSPEMIIIQRGGIPIYVNPAGLKLLGAENLEEVLARDIPLLPEAVQNSTPARVMRADGRDDYAFQHDEYITRMDGEKLRVRLTTMSIMYEDEKATQIIVQDVTRQMLISQLIKASQESFDDVAEMVLAFTYSMLLERDHNELKLMFIRGGFTELTGYTVDEMQDAAARWNVVYSEDHKVLRKHLRSALEGEMIISEYRLIARDGTLCWVRDYCRPVYDEQDGTRVIGLQGAIQNINEQVTAELTLKTYAIQRAVMAELGQHALMRGATLKRLADDVVTLIAQVLNVDGCVLYELDEKGGALKRVAAVGLAEELPLVAGDHSLAAYTLQGNHQVVINDVRSEKRHQLASVLSGMGVLSGVSLGIKSQKRALGALEIYNEWARVFTQDDVNFLQGVANIITAFIEQKRIETAEAGQRALAEALRDVAAVMNSTLQLEEVLDHMLTQLSRVLAHDAATVMIVEGRHARIIRHKGYRERGIPDEFLDSVRLPINIKPTFHHMIRTGQPVIISDVREEKGWVHREYSGWLRGYVGAPIMYQDQMLGIINVDSAQVDAFDENDAERLLAFANQASIALHNAQYARELEERVRARTEEAMVGRQRLQIVLDATGEGIFYLEGETILFANRMFCQMLHYEQGELEGRSIMTLLEAKMPSAGQMELISRALQAGEILRYEVKLRRKDETTFDANLTITSADQSETGGRRVVILVRDISQEKALEAQKTRFIANASHELRSPIASMNTHLYLLKRDPATAEQRVELLERITARMSRLVEDLLDLSRFENGIIKLHQRTLILQTLLLDVVELQQAEAEMKELTLQTDLEAEPLHVYVDPERILQVVTNLVNNAINYTPAGGTITLRAYSQGDGDTINAIIAVQDSGEGISDDALPHIFQPFYRVSAGNIHGTGLGLSIVQEIIGAHEGEVTVESEIGQGSTFYVQLPLLPEPTTS